ncbi:MAG: transcription-repair coupling factor [Gemmataceae bacterium]
MGKTDGVPGRSLSTLTRHLAAFEGWESLRAALLQNASGTIDGAWGSSAALACAAVAEVTPATLLIAVPNVGDLAHWAEDLNTFCGARPATFPAHENWPPTTHRGQLTSEASTRLRVLHQLSETNGPKVIVAPMAALVQPVPPRADLSVQGRRLAVNNDVDFDELQQWLVDHGYERQEAVEFPGEFARRGGIIDVFPPDRPDPLRLEFFGDTLESIRIFTTSTQRSLDKKTEVMIYDAKLSREAVAGHGHLADYLPAGSAIVFVEPADLREQGKLFFERVAEATGLFTVEGAFAQLMRFSTIHLSALPRASVEATCHLRVESVERFSGQMQRVQEELAAISGTDAVYITCPTEAEVKRLTEILQTGPNALAERLHIVPGYVRAGFRLVGEGVVVLGSHQLFQRDQQLPGNRNTAGTAPARRIESRAIDSFVELHEGDYVVHVAHGIARYRGMKMLEKGRMDGQGAEAEESLENAVEENLILEFREGVMLYIPASRIDLIQKYVGGSQTEPELSRLGSSSWLKKKDKVAEAVRDLAADMIQLQAVRNAVAGAALPADSEWQREFEAAFPYQETPDQLSAIQESKADLEKPKSMDRLICGDVGYGKTEVAIRAAFKCVDNGKQVAILVPTTILAEQHFRNFSQRFAEYPFRVACLSRFRSATEQKKIVKEVGDGEIDVVIGTHRLVSKDMKFKDLGLAIIDEEQRFGVDHKERLKRLRATVHVLTMTATPIPRTLHAALLGIREISNLETPPPERQPVETRIVRWDDQLIRHAILREMNRGGQVYFVHNRVHDIQEIAAKIAYLVPDARIVIGHGQMSDDALEAAMVKFLRKEADILVATTIIESGVDIPTANTMFIDDADQYGLADLHQLRGRVGRQRLRAYAYLIVNPLKMMTANAQKRLKAIEEFTELGAGFKIAMRDLEIRGAGNILGTEQSGHIAAVGYEMYCHLLENAVRTLKQLPPRQAVEVNVDLPWPAFLPRDYVPGQKLRIEVYRRLARLRELPRLDDFRQELHDRYGKPPEPVEWLLRTTQIRLLCVKWQVAGIHRNGKDLVFRYRNRKRADELAAASRTRLKVVDDTNLYVRLKPEEDTPAAMFKLLQRLLTPPSLPSPAGPLAPPR